MQAHKVSLIFVLLFVFIFSKIEVPYSLELSTDTASSAEKAQPKKVSIISIEEQVDAGLYYFLKRAVNEALEEKPDIIIFKVNTFGGELHSAFEIVELILSISEATTYAYVHQKAISAGALISLANNNIVMENGTTIGDCAPITQTQEGIKVMGEKIQSPLRAKFRALAEKNGYPSLLSQAMVTMEMEVIAAYPKDDSQKMLYYTARQWEGLSKEEKSSYNRHKIVVEKGELLTMTDKEAYEYGFSQGSFSSLDDFIKSRNWQVLSEHETSWSENMVRTLGKFAPILMLLGFGCLYMELKTPGFGIFGISGIVLLSIVFGSKYLVGLADHTELLLLIIGSILFLVEIFIFPGTLFFGVTGVFFMIVSLILSMQGFTIPDPKFPWEMQTLLNNTALTLGMALLAIVVPFLGIKYIIPHMPRKMSVIPDTTLKNAKVTTIESKLRPGMEGVSKTWLRPYGKAVFNNKLYEVQAISNFIEADRKVEVVSVSGNKSTVKEVSA